MKGGAMLRKVLHLSVAGLMMMGLAAGPANAGDDEVRREGSCSGRSDWELRVRLDDGRFRVRWRVDSRIAGQTWRMRLFHDGERIAAATRTTNADGEATIDLRGVPNNEGEDTFRGRARNPNTDETCAGQVVF
jgi:hypothetical protein